MITFSTWDIIRNLLLAVRWTILLSLTAFVLGSALGLLILFIRTSKHKALQQAAKIYIEVFQGTPLLMQLFLVFFGLALFGLEVPAWLAAGLALTLWSASFLAEIWRGCVEAIPRGQWEASVGAGHEQSATNASHHLAAGIAHRDCAHRRFRRADHQGYGGHLNHRFRRVIQSRHRDHQRHLHAVHRVCGGRLVLFCLVLAAVEVQPILGKEIQCRSSPLTMSRSASVTMKCSKGSGSTSTPVK